MHKYPGGKRGYRSFVCMRCPTVVRADKVKLEGRWECYRCAAPPSSVQRDKKGNKQVGFLF